MHKWEAAFSGRLVMVGFGSIGQGVLPLLLRHIDMRPEQVVVIDAHDGEVGVADAFGVQHVVAPLRQDNYSEILARYLRPGDFLLNLSVGVSSTALIAYCRDRHALYLDTCIEAWPGAYTEAQPLAARTNYALRESALALRRTSPSPSTAVLTHGANPGLVSHFLKQALVNIAHDTGVEHTPPDSREKWARLAQRLGVRVIHINERDTQVTNQHKQMGEFVNTWSVQAFIDEATRPAELGWGTHERHFPSDGTRHTIGCRAGIFLSRPGAGSRVRSWAPIAGLFHGFLVTHAESIAIADYLTLGDGAHPAYRPTVHYAYYPCDDAVLSLHELAGNNWQATGRQRLIRDEIVSGRDELGVLLMGHPKGAYWYGSQLTIDEARAACSFNSATSLQVAASVMAGVVWAINNPVAGIVEPEDMPYEEILRLCQPYLGNVAGVYTDWSPLVGRGRLFEEDLDRADRWQFKNFRVL